MQHDEPRALGAAGRRILRYLDRLFGAAVIHPSVEPQRAEARVDELRPLKALVIDDRDEARPQPHHPGP